MQHTSDLESDEEVDSGEEGKEDLQVTDKCKETDKLEKPKKKVSFDFGMQSQKKKELTGEALKAVLRVGNQECMQASVVSFFRPEDTTVPVYVLLYRKGKR